jgi:hypothetical protein
VSRLCFLTTLIDNNVIGGKPGAAFPAQGGPM